MWRSYGCNNSACVEAAWQDFSNPSGNCVQVQWTTPCWDGSCLEVAFEHACADNTCVDVAYESSPATESGASVEVVKSDPCPWVHVRDSKDAENSPVLVWPREAWKGGSVVDFIRIDPAEVRPQSLRDGRDPEADWYVVLGVTEEGDDAALYFDQAEVDAFDEGRETDFFSLTKEPASVA
jgi:hypothetical protein